MTTRRIWLPTAAIALAVAAATYYYHGDVAADGPPVTTAAVTRGNVVATVEATGTLEAVTTVEVGTQLSGTLESLGADFNSRVRKGQVIARLDPSLFETQVAQERATVQRLSSEVERARVQAEDAQVKLQRARDLAARQLIARSDLDAAESTARAAEAAVKSADAQLVQGKASLNQAEVNLSHTIIRAPIDGVVIARNVDVGQTVAASMQAPTLFVIAQDLTEMRVNAKVDESDIGKIQPEQPVRFRVDAYPNESFVGSVSQVRLQPVVEQNVVSYVTVIDVPNKELQLKPGMTAAVTIETGRANDVLKVPNAALRFEPDADLFAKLGQQPPAHGNAGAGAPARADASARARAVPAASGERRGTTRDRSRAVWVFQDGRLTRVDVQPGLSDGTQTMVSGSLTAGMHVVTSAASATAASAPSTMRSPLLPAGRRTGAGGRS